MSGAVRSCAWDLVLNFRCERWDGDSWNFYVYVGTQDEDAEDWCSCLSSFSERRHRGQHDRRRYRVSDDERSIARLISNLDRASPAQSEKLAET